MGNELTLIPTGKKCIIGVNKEIWTILGKPKFGSDCERVRFWFGEVGSVDKYGKQ